MIIRPSRRDCTRIRDDTRIYDVHRGEIGAVIAVAPTSIEIKWPEETHVVCLSHKSIMMTARYCLI